jgi:hypothetical protein
MMHPVCSSCEHEEYENICPGCLVAAMIPIYDVLLVILALVYKVMEKCKERIRDKKIEGRVINQT